MKYYYTCPLKAAYMAKYFGMKYALFHADGHIVSEIKRENIEKDVALGESEISRLFLQSGNFGKYYIHPDSLHLLEPMVGDLVGYAGPEANDFDVYSHDDWHGCPLKKIIQRNVIPFMWPESELEKGTN